MGYTLDQLKQLGATPGSTVAPDAAANAYRTMLNNVKTGNVYAATDTSQPSGSGIEKVGGLLKDAAQTLLVKPATRIGQAISAPFVKQNMDSTTNIQNQQTDKLQSVLDRMKVETDPVKHEALRQMAFNLVKEATPNTQAGQEATRENNSLSEDQNVNVGGTNFDIPGQQTGLAGGKQILGDALKSASYLAAPEALGAATAPEASLAEKALSGAKFGGAVGAAGGAGNALEDPNSGIGTIAKDTLEGAAFGAGTGAAIPAAIEGVGQVPKLLDKTSSQIEQSQQTVKNWFDSFSGKNKVSEEAQNALNVQAEHEANIKQAEIESNQNLTQVQKEQAKNLIQTQLEHQQNLNKTQRGLTSAEKEANTTAKIRNEAAPKAVDSYNSMMEQVSGHKSSLGINFAKGAQKLTEDNPELKLNLTNAQVDGLNGLKESKNFALPSYLDKEANPFVGQFANASPDFIAKAGKVLDQINKGTEVSLTPSEAQDLITQLNKKTFIKMADGSLQVDQRVIDLTNQIKQSASESFGTEWDNLYSNYAKGINAVQKIDDIVNLSRDATASDYNKALKSILKISETPEGKILLQNALEDYKNISGIDLSDPVKAIQDIQDKQSALEEAQGKVEEAKKTIFQTTKEGEQNIEKVKKEGQQKISKTDKEGQQKISKTKKLAEKEITKAQKLAQEAEANRGKGVKNLGKYVGKSSLSGAIRIGLLYPLIRAIMKAVQGK